MTADSILIVNPCSKGTLLKSFLEHRRAYRLDAEMPLLLNLPEARLACRESLSTFEAINAHFSAQVHAYFNALDDFDRLAASDNDLIRQEPDLHLDISTIAQSFDIYPRCLHRVFHNRRLTVLDVESLPLLPHAATLSIGSEDCFGLWPIVSAPHRRPLSPRTPLELASRLPQLRELDCPLLSERFPIAFWSRAMRQYSRVSEGPWRDARIDFGRGVGYIMPLLPTSLTKIRFWFYKSGRYGDFVDQAAPMPDLIGAPSSSAPDEFGGMDPVSSGLRMLGSRLEDFDIRAMITPDIFRSSSWPHMRHFKVEFYPCAPNGSWYFAGPRGEDPHPTGYAVKSEEHYPPGQGNDEETHDLYDREEDEWLQHEQSVDNMDEDCRPDSFRILPIVERINPLLLAFAASLQQQKMPSLHDAELFTWLSWEPSEKRAQDYAGSDEVPLVNEDGFSNVLFRWGLRYDAPRGDVKGKVTWQVGERWRPENEVIRAFQNLVGEDEGSMEWAVFDVVSERWDV
jgi:hypothetical protein